MFKKSLFLFGILVTAFFNGTSFARDVTLSQGWTEQMQNLFYSTPLGTPMVHYDIFLSLEQENSTTLFLDDDFLESLGFLPGTRSILNPDKLPVGMTRDIIDGQQFLGTSCGLCHTTNITYTKTPRGRGQGLLNNENAIRNRTFNMRINGSSSVLRFQTYVAELLGALEATVNNSEKFDRLVGSILGSNPNQGEINKLRDRLEESYDFIKLYGVASESTLAWGPGRADAFTTASNFLTGFYNNEETAEVNIYHANAANSVPHIWSTVTQDFIQWTGAIASFATADNPDASAFAGATAATVLGGVALFATADIPKNKNQLGYESSIKLSSVRNVDNLLSVLKSPRWPNRILPRIDRQQARRGKPLYAEHCADCHQVIPRAVELLPYSSTILSVEELGTDPAGVDFLRRTYVSGNLEERLTQSLIGDEIGPTGALLELASNAFAGMLIGKLGEAEAGQFIIPGFNPILFGGNAPPLGYKGRPLNGIWATAPYLHNGSVPNLYELLLPAEERSDTFYVGSREYDPVHVGFIIEADNSGPVPPFLFDTSIRGNWNTGHEFGVHELTEEQRWDLLEYIKTL